MKGFLVAGTLVFAWVAGCSSPGPTSEPTAITTSPIQGGTSDSTHSFAVSVVQVANGGLGICSGALLAPNLVATARHCVVDATALAGAIDCATTKFPAATVAPSTLHVTTDPSYLVTIPLQGNFVTASTIIVPTAANSPQAANTSLLCGNDIALIILSQNITLPQYVEPVLSPALTDHAAWATTVSAIGYGLSTPANQNTAGSRRIKQNIGLVCIPNDKTFVDCFSDPTAKQYMSANEFQSGDGTCEGDSGSSAYDQTKFDSSTWVSFGVLSRGGVSSDGQTCIGSVYTRFDAWSQLVIDAANQAAQAGGYPPPTWAGSSSADAGTGDGGGDGGASTGKGDGTSCGADAECASHNCVSTDNKNFVCASTCGSSGSCPSNFSCKGESDAAPGFCFSSSFGSTTTKSGCAVATDSPSDPVPWRYPAAGLGLAAVVVARRRRRR